MNQLGTTNRLRRAAIAAVAMLIVLPIGLSTTVGAQDADYSLLRIEACSPGAGQSDVPGAGVLRITNNADTELSYSYTTAAGAIADTTGIPAGDTVAVPIPSDDELPTVNVGGTDVEIPAANGCGFGLQTTYDPCPDSTATGYDGLLINNLPDRVTVDVDGSSVMLDRGDTPFTVPFEATFVATYEGEIVATVVPAIGCSGPLSILVAPPACPTTTPVVEDTAVLNRVDVSVTFSVDGKESTVKPGEIQVFEGTGENPEVLVGGRQQALLNQDPAIEQQEIDCEEPPPSSPSGPPSAPSSPAPLSPKFTG